MCSVYGLFKKQNFKHSRHHGTYSSGVAAHVKDVNMRGKGEVHPKTGHEGLGGGSRCIALLFL
jgi:hypothetical protein